MFKQKQNYETLRKQKHIHNLEFDERPIDIILKEWLIKEKFYILDIIKIKNVDLLEALLRKWKDKPTGWKKPYQITFKTKDLYLKYVNNSSSILWGGTMKKEKEQE